MHGRAISNSYYRMQDAKTSAAQLLKSETAKAHENIEGTFPVMHSDFSLSDYRVLLVKMYAFYLKLEEMISSSGALKIIGIDYEKRRKLHMIKADLNFFGIDESELADIHPYKPWFTEPSEGELLGMLYVLEGSTLGGQLISKHLSEKFQLTTGEGVSFFTAYGTMTGVMWKEFQAVLNKNLTSLEKTKAAVESAQTMFRDMGRWLKSSYAEVNSNFEMLAL